MLRLQMRSAIILAGGRSTRMNGEKGLRTLEGVPLVNHVIRRVSGLVDDVFLVLGSREQRDAYTGVVDGGVELLVDIYEDSSPLVGAMTGFERAGGGYALVTGCDMPFIQAEAVQLLFREAQGHDGAVFLWPNGWIEPLLAVYNVEASLSKAAELYDKGELRIRMILRELGDVSMIPVETLKEFDPDLLTLFDADTEGALREAEELLKK